MRRRRLISLHQRMQRLRAKIAVRVCSVAAGGAAAHIRTRLPKAKGGSMLQGKDGEFQLSHKDVLLSFTVSIGRSAANGSDDILHR